MFGVSFVLGCNFDPLCVKIIKVLTKLNHLSIDFPACCFHWLSIQNSLRIMSLSERIILWLALTGFESLYQYGCQFTL